MRLTPLACFVVAAAACGPPGPTTPSFFAPDIGARLAPGEYVLGLSTGTGTAFGDYTAFLCLSSGSAFVRSAGFVIVLETSANGWAGRTSGSGPDRGEDRGDLALSLNELGGGITGTIRGFATNADGVEVLVTGDRVEGPASLSGRGVAGGFSGTVEGHVQFRTMSGFISCVGNSFDLRRR